MATATFFGAMELRQGSHALTGKSTGMGSSHGGRCGLGVPYVEELASSSFPWEAEFSQQHELVGHLESSPGETEQHGAASLAGEPMPLQYCLLSFHTPVVTPPNSVVLGSRLDTTVFGSGNTAKIETSEPSEGFTEGDGGSRIAFYGRLVTGAVDDGKGRGEVDGEFGLGTRTGQLKLYNERTKAGVVFRVGAAGGEVRSGHAITGTGVEVLGKGLFKKETNMSPFVGMVLHTQVRRGSVGAKHEIFGIVLWLCL